MAAITGAVALFLFAVPGVWIGVADLVGGGQVRDVLVLGLDGVRYPLAECRRLSLNQWTQESVASSSSSTLTYKTDGGC